MIGHGHVQEWQASKDRDAGCIEQRKGGQLAPLELLYDERRNVSIAWLYWHIFLGCCLMWSTMVQVLRRHQVKLLRQVADLNWPALCQEIAGGRLKRARPPPAADSIPTAQPTKVADSFQHVAYLSMMSSVAICTKGDFVLVVF